MRVKIGPYVNWLGPYQLAEKLCFWAKPEKDEFGFEKKPDWVHNFGEWLAHGSVEPDEKPGDITSWNRDRHDTLLSRFLTWIHSKQERKIKVQIDPWDTWSMDHTLAYIILPMLKQLKEKQHGAGFVDDKDVPKELRSTAAEPKENEYDTDSNHFKRWEWVMDEMIFAFNSKIDDSWEDQFQSGEHDIQWVRLENGHSQMIKGPKDTFDINMKGRKAYEKRIQNGFALFGKYYQNLWD
jgi:hypothetical protein